MSSRESDNAYPPPRRGGAPGRRPGEGPDAYPSGTPPYGTPGIANGFGAGAPVPGGDPSQPSGRGYPDARPGTTDGAAQGQDVPKTETTLTTRISINIPGSRPIPPVVVRSPVKPEETEGGAGTGAAEGAARPGPAGPRHRSPGSASPVLGVMDAGGRTAMPPDLPSEWQTPPTAETSESESTGEWFRPRQKLRAEPSAAPAPTPSPAAAPAPAATAASGLAAGSPYQSAERRQAPPATPAFSAETSQQIPVPRPTGTPASPFASGDEPSGGPQPFGAPHAGYPTDPYATGPADPSPAPGGGYPDAARPAHPYAGPADATAADPFGAGPATHRRTPQPGAPGRFARPQAPLSPYSQPQSPFADGHLAAEQEPWGTPRPEASGEPEDTQIGGFSPITGDLPPSEAIPGLPVNGHYGAAPGAPRGTTATAPTTARPAGSQRAEHLEASESGTGPAAAPAEATPSTGRAAKPKPASRARKLLVYAVAGALFAGAAVYGTGLMLNQADVPRGTIVLGTDIGGDSRDQAIHQLDATVGKTGQQPIQLKFGGQTVALDPATAGLSFDTTATVDGLTKHSYNPVTVIGSLAGGTTAVPPVVRVDRAKLQVALDGLGAQSAQGLKEGFVQFSETGDPTVVPGQAGQAVNGSASVDQVQQSYLDRAAGKTDAPITLTVTAAQPKVSTQALQQAADGLGKAIVSGKVTVVAGARRFVFTKAIAAKTLTLAPDASGTIGPKWDLDQLSTALGTVFDKVKYRKSDGTLAAITPQDVADAIASVYDKNTTTERTFQFRM